MWRSTHYEQLQTIGRVALVAFVPLATLMKHVHPGVFDARPDYPAGDGEYENEYHFFISRFCVFLQNGWQNSARPKCLSVSPPNRWRYLPSLTCTTRWRGSCTAGTNLPLLLLASKNGGKRADTALWTRPALGTRATRGTPTDAAPARTSRGGLGGTSQSPRASGTCPSSCLEIPGYASSLARSSGNSMRTMIA